MRASLVLAGITAALLCTSATAQSISEHASGTIKLGGTFPYFESSLGVLDSVVIEGTLTAGTGLVRDPLYGETDTLPALSIPQTMAAGLSINYGSEIVETELSGFETYEEGSIFGGVGLSGSVYTTLTGGDVNQFVDPGGLLLGGIQEAGFITIPHDVGRPTSVLPGGSFDLTLTYYFHNYVPEPPTWVTMLLGFGAIGFVMRWKRRSQFALG